MDVVSEKKTMAPPATSGLITLAPMNTKDILYRGDISGWYGVYHPNYSFSPSAQFRPAVVTVCAALIINTHIALKFRGLMSLGHHNNWLNFSGDLDGTLKNIASFNYEPDRNRPDSKSSGCVGGVEKSIPLKKLKLRRWRFCRVASAEPWWRYALFFVLSTLPGFTFSDKTKRAEKWSQRDDFKGKSCRNNPIATLVS